MKSKGFGGKLRTAPRLRQLIIVWPVVQPLLLPHLLMYMQPLRLFKVIVLTDCLTRPGWLQRCLPEAARTN